MDCGEEGERAISFFQGFWFGRNGGGAVVGRRGEG